MEFWQKHKTLISGIIIGVIAGFIAGALVQTNYSPQLSYTYNQSSANLCQNADIAAALGSACNSLQGGSGGYRSGGCNAFPTIVDNGLPPCDGTGGLNETAAGLGCIGENNLDRAAALAKTDSLGWASHVNNYYHLLQTMIDGGCIDPQYFDIDDWQTQRTTYCNGMDSGMIEYANKLSDQVAAVLGKPAGTPASPADAAAYREKLNTQVIQGSNNQKNAFVDTVRVGAYIRANLMANKCTGSVAQVAARGFDQFMAAFGR